MSQTHEVRLRRYLGGDHHQVKLRPEQIMDPYRDYMINDVLKLGRAHSLIVDGRVMACGGIASLCAGRAVAWGFVGKDIPLRVWPRALPLIKQEIDQAASHITRLEVTVRADIPALWNFARRLGFRIEATMSKYDGANPYYLGVILS